MAGLDPGTKINLAKASVMVMESNQHAADMLNQILKGFGVGEVYRCTTVAESLKVISTNTIDLIVADPKLRDGDAFEILYELRHSKTEPVCYVPVIILSGHSTSSQVKSSRDIGVCRSVQIYRPRSALQRSRSAEGWRRSAP
jgi:DNA-binding response OmpR family regulator